MKVNKNIVFSILSLFLLLNFLSFTNSLNPYKVLNLPSYSTWKQIKDRYKEYAKKYHPDKHKSDPNYEQYKVKFRDISEAYEILKEKRKVNDNTEDDSHFESLIIETVALVLGIILYSKLQILFFKFITWVLESISTLVVILVCCFHISDRFFDHHFEDDNYKIGFCLIFSVILVIIKRLLFSSSSPKANEEEKEKEKTN